MGNRENEFAKAPGVWKQIEIDLMGPFTCRSDVNKRSTIKVWAAVIEDVYSGAVYCYIVMDYSAQTVMMILR